MRKTYGAPPHAPLKGLRPLRIPIIKAIFILIFILGNGVEGAAEDAALYEGRWLELAQRYSNDFVPDDYFADAPSSQVLASWWDVLSDDVLTSLIGDALAQNRDMQSARAKVFESRAALGITKAAALPWLDSTDSLTRSKTSENAAGTGQTVSVYSLGLDASWEIDFFGQRRNLTDAGIATLEADYASLHAAWTSLSSEVALAYLSLRTLQERLDIARENLALRTDTLKLAESQYNAGLKNALVLNQAQYSMEQARASIPALRVSAEAALNALAILTGRVPGELEWLWADRKPLPKLEASGFIGIPAGLLRRRPDIFAAERRLAAQISRRKAAEKDLLPKFSLFGSIGLESFSGGSLFSDSSVGFAFGPRVSLPLFHAGAIRKNISVQSAREEQLLAAYEQTVLSAVAEVRDALTANVQERERNESLKSGAAAARSAYEVAEDMYRNGLTDFNNVILAQQALLSFEESCAVSDGQMVSNVVRLFKSLGGGWGGVGGE